MESMRCSSCGCLNELTESSCKYCGAALPRTQDGAEATSVEASGVQTGGKSLLTPIAILTVVFISLFLIGMFPDTSWNSPFRSVFGPNVGWRIYWLVVGALILAASITISVATNKDKWSGNVKKIALRLHAFIGIMFIVMLALFAFFCKGWAPECPFALCAFSAVIIEVVVVVILILPINLIAGILILAGITFPFGVFGLISFDNFWKRKVMIRFLTGFVVAAIGAGMMLYRNKHARSIVKRKIVWVPMLILCICIPIWSFFLKPLFAYLPLNGGWQGRGEGRWQEEEDAAGDTTEIKFTVENGIIKDVTVMLVSKQGTGLSFLRLGGGKVESGEFSIGEEESGTHFSVRTQASINGVFDSKTQASGKLYLEQAGWESGPRTPPTFIARTWEGKWTAQLEPQNK